MNPIHPFQTNFHPIDTNKDTSNPRTYPSQMRSEWLELRPIQAKLKNNLLNTECVLEPNPLLTQQSIAHFSHLPTLTFFAWEVDKHLAQFSLSKGIVIQHGFIQAGAIGHLYNNQSFSDVDFCYLLSTPNSDRKDLFLFKEILLGLLFVKLKEAKAFSNDEVEFDNVKNIIESVYLFRTNPICKGLGRCFTMGKTDFKGVIMPPEGLSPGELRKFLLSLRWHVALSETIHVTIHGYYACCIVNGKIQPKEVLDTALHYLKTRQGFIENSQEIERLLPRLQLMRTRGYTLAEKDIVNGLNELRERVTEQRITYLTERNTSHFLSHYHHAIEGAAIDFLNLCDFLLHPMMQQKCAVFCKASAEEWLTMKEFAAPLVGFATLVKENPEHTADLLAVMRGLFLWEWASKKESKKYPLVDAYSFPFIEDAKKPRLCASWTRSAQDEAMGNMFYLSLQGSPDIVFCDFILSMHKLLAFYHDKESLFPHYIEMGKGLGLSSLPKTIEETKELQKTIISAFFSSPLTATFANNFPSLPAVKNLFSLFMERAEPALLMNLKNHLKCTFLKNFFHSMDSYDDIQPRLKQLHQIGINAFQNPSKEDKEFLDEWEKICTYDVNKKWSQIVRRLMILTTTVDVRLAFEFLDKIRKQVSPDDLQQIYCCLIKRGAKSNNIELLLMAYNLWKKEFSTKSAEGSELHFAATTALLTAFLKKKNSIEQIKLLARSLLNDIDLVKPSAENKGAISAHLLEITHKIIDANLGTPAVEIAQMSLNRNLLSLSDSFTVSKILLEWCLQDGNAKIYIDKISLFLQHCLNRKHAIENDRVQYNCFVDVVLKALVVLADYPQNQSQIHGYLDHLSLTNEQHEKTANTYLTIIENQFDRLTPERYLFALASMMNLFRHRFAYLNKKPRLNEVEPLALQLAEAYPTITKTSRPDFDRKFIDIFSILAAHDALSSFTLYMTLFTLASFAKNLLFQWAWTKFREHPQPEKDEKTAICQEICLMAIKSGNSHATALVNELLSNGVKINKQLTSALITFALQEKQLSFFPILTQIILKNYTEIENTKTISRFFLYLKAVDEYPEGHKLIKTHAEVLHDFWEHALPLLAQSQERTQAADGMIAIFSKMESIQHLITASWETLAKPQDNLLCRVIAILSGFKSIPSFYENPLAGIASNTILFQALAKGIFAVNSKNIKKHNLLFDIIEMLYKSKHINGIRQANSLLFLYLTTLTQKHFSPLQGNANQYFIINLKKPKGPDIVYPKNQKERLDKLIEFMIRSSAFIQNCYYIDHFYSICAPFLESKQIEPFVKLILRCHHHFIENLVFEEKQNKDEIIKKAFDDMECRIPMFAQWDPKLGHETIKMLIQKALLVSPLWVVKAVHIFTCAQLQKIFSADEIDDVVPKEIQKTQPAKNSEDTNVETIVKNVVPNDAVKLQLEELPFVSTGLEITCKTAESWSKVADSNISSHDYYEAISEASIGIALDPSFVNAYVTRGKAYMYLRKFPEALKDIDKAIKLNPKCSEAWKTRSSINLAMGNEDEALHDLCKSKLQNNEHFSS